MNANDDRQRRPSRIEAAKERVADVKATLAAIAAALFVVVAFLARGHHAAAASAAAASGSTGSATGAAVDSQSSSDDFGFPSASLGSAGGAPSASTHAS
jgi:hypothetical protein